MRVVDERLSLSAPGERRPRGRGGRDHGAGGIDRVAALLEDLRARGGRDRFAGDRHPVPAVERGLLGAALRVGSAEDHAGTHHRGDGGACQSRKACRGALVARHVRPSWLWSSWLCGGSWLCWWLVARRRAYGRL